MLAQLALRRSLSVATSLNVVPSPIILSARYSVGAKGGKPAPKPATPAKKTTPPPPPAKKPATPPPSKAPVKAPAKKAPPPPSKAPVKTPAKANPATTTQSPPPPARGSKGSVVAKEQEQRAKEKEKEKELKEKEREKEKQRSEKLKEQEAKEKQKDKEREAKDKQKEKETKEKQKAKLAKVKEHEKDQKVKEKERDKERKLKEKEKAENDKEKEKHKQQKLKEKAEKEKQEAAEKKREEKEKKDAMPSRAKSAYICFAIDVRSTVVKEKPDIGNTGVMGEIAKRWTVLPKEKREKYEQMAEQDKARFEKELKEFKRQYPDPPKRAASAFSLYVKENSAVIKKSQPKAKVTEIIQTLAKQWHAITPEKKKKYEDLAEQEKSRYLKEKEKFEKSQSD